MERQKELSFVRFQITQITKELTEAEPLYAKVHKQAIDKDSSFEQIRHQGRMSELSHNYNLLKSYQEQEKTLLKKLSTIKKVPPLSTPTSQ